MIVRRLSLAAAGVSLSLVAASPVAAHHSFAAEFDAKAPVTLKGIVTQMDWVNPHSGSTSTSRILTARSPAG
jgi:hypothetical protein